MHLFDLRKLVIVGLSLLAGSAATAQSIFDFRNIAGGAGADLHGLASGSTTIGDLTMTATLFPDGVFNQTKDGFGVNAAMSGDDTDEFDPGEGFTFLFNQDVFLTSIKVSSFGVTGSGLVSFDGGLAIASILTTGVTSLGNTFVSAGTVLRFESNSVDVSLASSDFSLDSITLSAVPETATGSLLAGAIAIGWVMVRRKRDCN